MMNRSVEVASPVCFCMRHQVITASFKQKSCENSSGVGWVSVMRFLRSHSKGAGNAWGMTTNGEDDTWFLERHFGNLEIDIFNSQSHSHTHRNHPNSLRSRCLSPQINRKMWKLNHQRSLQDKVPWLWCQWDLLFMSGGGPWLRCSSSTASSPQQGQTTSG